MARVLRHLPGGTFTGPGYLAPDVVAGLGRIAGRVGVALVSFAHPGLDRVLQWDPRYADEVLRRLASALLDPHKLARALDAALGCPPRPRVPAAAPGARRSPGRAR
jgi:Ser/Thr protein kinase RdoA (MazF antagonist)